MAGQDIADRLQESNLWPELQKKFWRLRKFTLDGLATFEWQIYLRGRQLLTQHRDACVSDQKGNIYPMSNGTRRNQ